ncbi:tripartite tricarboxylate transporter substrate-binding protein [Rugosimonospora acidiphila]|uniref:Tripartite tricarboxylate transporter substrate-binding protein n=1 Tax=Rugosimonospora acidiphila TaxID=556531 RepID=A0ABP9SSE8_9ACTN
MGIVLLSLVLVVGMAGCARRGSSAGGAAGDKAATFYQGKTITITTKSSPGGNGDTTARLLAQYLPDYIPGHPHVVVKNNAGGAGSVMMKNVAQVFPNDGLNLALPDTAVVLRWMFKQAGSDYPLDKMPIIGDVTAPLVVVVRKSAGTDLAALQKRAQPLKAGSTAPGGTGVIDMTLGFGLLNIPVKEVYGYSGAGPVALALERGEADTASPAAGAYLSSYKTLSDRGIVYPFYQVGDPGPNNTLVRSPALSEFPTLQEVYQQQFGHAPTGPEWNAVLKLADMVQLGLFLCARPDTPPAALTALRQGFDKMAADDKVKTKLNTTLGGAVSVGNGEAATLLKNLLATSGDLLTSLENAANGK